MARKTLYVSDLTGAEIPEGSAAYVQIILDSKPDSRFYLEVGEAEVAELLSRAQEQRKRGRKTKAKAKSA